MGTIVQAHQRDRSPAPSRHRRGLLSRSLALMTGIAAGVLGGAHGTQDAVANGDTRTISIFHSHTKESATITFKRDGRYDRAALEQLNWMLRDWRVDEPTKMDPRLFDTVWEAYRSVGSSEPITVVSAYRSPGTNAMLRRRSRGVAEFSQHTRGKAMDFYLPDVSVDRIRAVGMQMQRGGVGWYPSAGSPFVHLDVGSVRSWPRMSHDQLARLFPDGRTVHLPSDNRPLARYEEARAEILSRGGTVLGYTQNAQGGEEDEGPSLKGFFAGLFGGGSRPSEAQIQAPAAPAKARTRPIVAVASADPEDTTGTRAALAYAAAEQTAKSARRDGRDAQSLLTAEPQAVKDTVQAIMPAPPRRPSEFAAVAAALAMPPPPPRPSVQVASLGTAGMANLGPVPARAAATANLAAAEPDPLPASARLPPDSDPRAQMRWLFAVAVAQSIDRVAPVVHMAIARPRTEGAPDGLVARPADAMAATRFTAQGSQAPATARFSGSATQALAPR
ncbi:peptidase domain containing protein [Methylobacterium sp. Leaf399]|nr:peptidase domain containing protein [Methylobacterium sp. Leaf399]